MEKSKFLLDASLGNNSLIEFERLNVARWRQADLDDDSRQYPALLSISTHHPLPPATIQELRQQTADIPTDIQFALLFWSLLRCTRTVVC